jgi:hypothetical protein
VLFAYGLLVYCSTIEYYDHIDRLSAVSKATGRSDGGPQPIRILSPIDGGVRGIAALERSFASRGEAAARGPDSRAPSSRRWNLSFRGRRGRAV